jgi:rubrerythrin
MGGINSTAENLQAAINGENYEVVNMYPEFIKDAESEGIKKALNTFRWAMEVEKGHEELYRKALQAVEAGSDAPAVEYYVCPFCGYTHEGPMEGACPVCGTPGEKFERIE